jgi:hypothetical protein
MKKFSFVLASVLMFAACVLLYACDDSNGFVTVRSDTGGTGVVEIDSGLKVEVAGWGGGAITISDTLEDDAIQVALPGQLAMAGRGFIWIPGGITTSETKFTFPFTEQYAEGTQLALYWFDVEHVVWIPFADVQGVVTDVNPDPEAVELMIVVTLPFGGTGLGGNFAIAGTPIQTGGA